MGPWSLDRTLMLSLVVLSSSEPARLAAAAWLAAFDAARADGVAEPEANARARRAWQVEVGRESGAAQEDWSMLAATSGRPTDARSPPLAIA
jgi:hypothetical protein